MHKKLPYFPLFTSDFMQGTLLFDAQETGAYILLLCYQWDNGFVPSDEKSIKKIAKISRKKLEKVLKKFTLTSDSFYINSKVEEVRDKSLEKSIKASDSANSRWVKERLKDDANALRTQSERTANAMPPIQSNPIHTNTNVLDKEGVTPPSPTPEKKNKVVFDYSGYGLYTEIMQKWVPILKKRLGARFSTQEQADYQFENLKDLSGGDLIYAAEIVKHSDLSGYKGLYLPKNGKQNIKTDFNGAGGRTATNANNAGLEGSSRGTNSDTGRGGYVPRIVIHGTGNKDDTDITDT
jgi:uncharacterized protein YdaU (DUF1376 family)